MNHDIAVGIQSVGIYLPETIRTNAWWPQSIVDRWQDKIATRKSLRGGQEKQFPPGAERVFAAMAEFEDDPFKGSFERRVMAEGMVASDIETAAAEDAIARAGIDRREIGLLMTYTQLPDYLVVPTAPMVHQKLGLSESCFSMGTEGACNSFLMQYALAEQMIRGGQARYALLIQSSGLQHIIDPAEPHSAWFGDGATAVIVGPVSSSKGLLGKAHRTDGRFYKALVGGSPGTRWYKAEGIKFYVEDHSVATGMVLQVAELGKVVVDAALEQAGIHHEDVRFYASHQGTPWLRRLSQEVIGLPNARFFDSYRWTASLGAANIPFELGMAEREHLLQDGDVVAMYAGGSGITWSGMVMRWGR